MFDIKKAKYRYSIATDRYDITGDVDLYKKIKCHDGKFRFLAFEVKHPNERNSSAQLFGIHEFLKPGIPLIVCRIVNPLESAVLVDGLITNEEKTKSISTKIPFFVIEDCVVTQIISEQISQEYIGKTVRDLIEGIESLKTGKRIFSTDCSSLWDDVNSFNEKWK